MLDLCLGQHLYENAQPFRAAFGYLLSGARARGERTAMGATRRCDARVGGGKGSRVSAVVVAVAVGAGAVAGADANAAGFLACAGCGGVGDACVAGANGLSALRAALGRRGGPAISMRL